MYPSLANYFGETRVFLDEFGKVEQPAGQGERDECECGKKDNITELIVSDERSSSCRTGTDLMMCRKAIGAAQVVTLTLEIL
jgi:hypothetical protein